jgi:predicted nucleotidyltransferase
MDYMGVTYTPLEYWVGTKTFEQFQWKDENTNSEGTIYDIRKYLKLACGSNPNIIELFFIPAGSDHVVFEDEDIWWEILEAQSDIISMKAFHTFSGYAHSQLHKLMQKQSNKTGRRLISDEHGYDTKFAMHCMRLITQGIELITTGHITFPRPDAQELLDIRGGKTWATVEECIGGLVEARERLEDLKYRDVLPHSASQDWLNEYLVGFFQDHVY